TAPPRPRSAPTPESGDGAALLPSNDRDPSPLTRCRGDRELVRQPLGARQPEPESTSRGIAIPHREGDIGNARTRIGERQPKAPPARLIDMLDDGVPAPAVLDHVARQFAGGRHDLRLIDEAEAKLDRVPPDELPHGED